ncbi:GNAT family N-acetyltransferase [Gryllotalpicola reticulitermitis]|uniref:GNAT family N-acetyltransferase n=1 Tax=Gryllotalpicola reticulitermitis TaxID=1184153 RepID=A0ABV8Q222_9MICO
MTTLSPLRERVDAPHRLELPIHPDIVVWRPLTATDAPALGRLHAAADAVDHPDWVTPEAELRDRLSRSYVDLEHDSIAGISRTGDIVAYGLNLVDQKPSTLVRVILNGAIDPAVRGRGLGRQLLQWQRGRGQQQLAASDLALPGWILSWQPAHNESAVALARLLGFRPVRYSDTLTRDLTKPITPHEPDPAIRIVPWTPSLSAATLDAHRAAFRDHWGSQPTGEETWSGLLDGPFIRHDLTFLAVPVDDPENVVGYAVTSVFEHDFESQGYTSSYLDLLGTRSAWRGRGIASALLSRVLTATKTAGLERVVLDVDSENPTGAVGLYVAQGFEPNDDRQVALLLNY